MAAKTRNPRNDAARRMFRQLGCEVFAANWMREDGFAWVMGWYPGSEDRFLDIATRTGSPIKVTEERTANGRTSYLVDWA